MKAPSLPGFRTSLGPGRRDGGSWVVPVSVRPTRTTRVRLALGSSLIRLAALVLPELARRVVRRRFDDDRLDVIWQRAEVEYQAGAPSTMLVFYVRAEVEHIKRAHLGSAQDCDECYAAIRDAS